MFGMQFNAGASREAIRRAIGQLEDMTPIFTRVAEYMKGATEDRIQKGVSPTGAAWAPKSAATLERYRRLGYGAKTRPLILKGALSSTVQRQASRDGAVIGSSLVYSRVMQEGAAKGAFGSDRHGRPIPWGRIPARAWLGISTEDEREIVEIVDEEIDLALGGSS
jgi:phage gpG-like protein